VKSKALEKKKIRRLTRDVREKGGSLGGARTKGFDAIVEERKGEAGDCGKKKNLPGIGVTKKKS